MSLRTPKFVVLALFLAIPAFCSAVEAARVWEAQLAIPTYELGPPDPNPAFPELASQGRRPIYPYPVLDNLTGKRVERLYRAAYLENEYLRVTVLPELGGHLYAIYDKAARRDVLYTNHVVKYGLVAIRGAWVSGGIEWNFPDGHTATTVSPIDYTLRAEPDGSAAVIVGDTERVQGMQWAVAIRLRPGTKYVETDVTLYNRLPVPGRYWYWATAAAPAADDLRFVYPMREAYPHTFWPVFSFPVYRGVDLGTYREVPNPLSLFARKSMRDFFGIYYEKSDWGIVHVADHRELAGKKTWTWGTDPSGSIWVDKLTDRDGQYVEFQAGRFETQMEHELLAPHRTERFVEYWIPLDRLGGPFNEANRDAVLRLAPEDGRTRLSIQVTTRTEDAEITVERGAQQIFQRKTTLDPAQVFSAVFEADIKATGSPLRVRVKSKEGRNILTWRSNEPVDGNPDFKPARRPAPEANGPSSAEQEWLEGMAADKKSDVAAARTAWHKSLKRDPGYSPALVSMGLSYYRTGEYQEAARYLTAALARDKDSGSAHYFLALVLHALGRDREAADHLTTLVRSGWNESLARYLLGELSLAAGETNEALAQLSQAVRLAPSDFKARTRLALTERAAGRLQEAQAIIDPVVGEMPLDYLALSERGEIYKAAGKTEEADRTREELWRLLSREPDSVLELAFDYASIGRTAEARAVLQEALRRSISSPMVRYTLGYFLDLNGEKDAARTQWDLGMHGNPALVFPHRVAEVAVLQAALGVYPGDGRAAYYLGNALAGLNRLPEALAAWSQAVKFDTANAVLWRNLAQALWQVAGKKEEAAAAFEKAVSLAPGEYHTYVEFDRLLAEMKASDRRIRLLSEAPDAVRSQSDVVQALAAAYVDAARFGEAQGTLERVKITSGEGETGALAIYRRACIGMAGFYAGKGMHALAAAEYIKATQYPPNLGVGRSPYESHAREFVAAAREMEAAGQADSAQALWRRAAEEPLKAPTEPVEPWSDNYYWKAVALERIGQKDQALALFSRLALLADERRMVETEDTPPHGAIRFLLAGLGLKALGKPAEARTMLAKVLELEPANELARSELGAISAVH